MESSIGPVQIRQMPKIGTANGHQNGHQIVVPEQVRVMTEYERIALKNGENGRYFLRVGEQIQPPQPILARKPLRNQGFSVIWTFCKIVWQPMATLSKGAFCFQRVSGVGKLLFCSALLLLPEFDFRRELNHECARNAD
jgi:hypothetical protein